MPIGAFKQIPRDLVEWAKFLRQTEVIPTDGSVGEDQIQDGEVTYSKIQNVTPDRLLGRDTSPAGQVQELTVSGGLEFTGTGIQRSALTGPVTASAGSNTTVITDKAVTYAKIQDVSTNCVLGRQTAGAGVVEEIICTAAGRALLDDADAAAQLVTLGLVSGTYTPTITGVTNVDATTAYSCQYLRVGSTVTVSGRVDVDTTAAAATEVRISLPIASDFANTNECTGVASASALQMSAPIRGDATNNAAMLDYVAVDTANRALWFTFTYRVI